MTLVRKEKGVETSDHTVISDFQNQSKNYHDIFKTNQLSMAMSGDPSDYYKSRVEALKKAAENANEYYVNKLNQLAFTMSIEDAKKNAITLANRYYESEKVIVNQHYPNNLMNLVNQKSTQTYQAKLLSTSPNMSLSQKHMSLRHKPLKRRQPQSMTSIQEKPKRRKPKQKTKKK